MSDRSRANFDLAQLVHPAQAFGHPSEVVNHPDLTTHEKPAILSSWASDAGTPEATRGAVPRGFLGHFDDIMDALRARDQFDGGRCQRAVSPAHLWAGRRSSQSATGLRPHSVWVRVFVGGSDRVASPGDAASARGARRERFVR